MPIMIDSDHQLHYLNVDRRQYIQSSINVDIIEMAIYRISTILAICTNGLLWEGSLSVNRLDELRLIELPFQLTDICVMSNNEILIVDDNGNLMMLDYETHQTELLYINVKRIIPNFEYSYRYNSITCTIVDVNDRIHFYSSTGNIVPTDLSNAEIIRESIIVADGILYSIILDEVVKLYEGLNDITDIVIINRVNVIILTIDIYDRLQFISPTKKEYINGIIPLRFVNMMRTSIIIEDVDYNLYLFDQLNVIRYELMTRQLLNIDRSNILCKIDCETRTSDVDGRA